MQQTVFETYESEVRSYCRSFPKVFDYAKGSIIKSTDGTEYIDFFCGAGAVNYGHNNDYIKQKIIDYMMTDGITHSLDMYTTAKAEFISFFAENILKPRGLDYKLQFAGPTGTNGVEAALKLARKVKGRSNVFALMGCFHGMTLASLALTSENASRQGAGVPLTNVTHIPAPYMFEGLDVIQYLDTILSDDHSGVDKPAAIIIETVQAEGGIHVFSPEFLKGIRNICDQHDIVMIVDDIQVGCGRTGTFFSFERADIVPDMVVLSKSIGGYGLPFALTLFKPEFDIWAPGEHNGTFRGNQMAMVAATAGLQVFLDEQIDAATKQKEAIVRNFMEQKIKPISDEIDVRGIGLIWGIDVGTDAKSKQIASGCFANGLIIERAGRDNSVVKLMPALTIPEEQLLKGLTIIESELKKLYA